MARNPPGRYGPFSHGQPPHIQHHASAQQHHTAQNQHALSHTSMTGHLGFGPNNPNSAANNPFTTFGNGVNNGTFEGGTLQQAQHMWPRNMHMQHFQNPRGPGAGQHTVNGRLDNSNGRIRNVWASTLEQEFEMIRQLVDDYPWISMDTEFPGIVARPMGQFTSKGDYHYQTLRCNVDLLKMIQLGLTLFNSNGNLPSPAIPTTDRKTGAQQILTCPCTWQFNFKFSLDSDMYAEDSTTMLKKAGIDFKEHEADGIDPRAFGAAIMMSGLVLNEDAHWISFHSGYDFAYLMKLLRGETPVPTEEDEFHVELEKWFPSIYDIKFLLKHASKHQTVNDDASPLSPEAKSILDTLERKNGLQDIADALGVKRIGAAHQAGSDSLLTGHVFFAMRDKVFGGAIDAEKYEGKVWGLNAEFGGANNALGLNRTPNLNGAVIYGNGAGGGGGGGLTPQTPGRVHLAERQQQVQQQEGTPAGMATGGAGSGVGAASAAGGFGQFSYARA